MHQEERRGKPGPWSRWTSAGDALKGWKKAVGMETDRMAILNQIWEREVGHFTRHWTLSGVRRGVLYVKVRSPAAGLELQFRSAQLVRSLNKYFKRSWLKGIRQA